MGRIQRFEKLFDKLKKLFNIILKKIYIKKNFGIMFNKIFVGMKKFVKWKIVIFVYNLFTLFSSILFPLFFMFVDILEVYSFKNCSNCNQLPFPMIIFIIIESVRYIINIVFYYCTTNENRSYFRIISCISLFTHSWIFMNIYVDWKHQTNCNDPLFFLDFVCLIISVGYGYKWYLYVIHLLGSIFLFINIIYTFVVIIFHKEYKIAEIIRTIEFDDEQDEDVVVAKRPLLKNTKKEDANDLQTPTNNNIKNNEGNVKTNKKFYI
jgi:hypothetical protein